MTAGFDAAEAFQRGAMRGLALHNYYFPRVAFSLQSLSGALW